MSTELAHGVMGYIGPIKNMSEPNEIFVQALSGQSGFFLRA